MSSSSSSTTSNPIKIRDIVGESIDNSKFGFYQIYTLLVCWGALFADGAEMLVISLLSHELEKSFKWTKAESSHYIGILGSLTFFGFLIGSLWGGKLIDIYGRRNLFILFNFCTFIFGFLSALATSFWILALCRFLTGLGVGGSIPCATAVLAEICPTKQRRKLILLKTVGFVLGEILMAFEAGLVLPVLAPEKAWRRLLILASIPGFVAFALSSVFLDESPRFIALRIARKEFDMKQLTDENKIKEETEKTKNSRQRLVDILNRIRGRNESVRACCNKNNANTNGNTIPLVPEEELKTKVNIFPRPKKQGQIMDLFKSTKQQPDRTRVTTLLFFVWFIQSYMYYVCGKFYSPKLKHDIFSLTYHSFIRYVPQGVIFIFPITLRHEGDSAKSMTGKVMIAASGELLGAFSAIFLVDFPFFGTRRLLLFEQALAAIAFFSCAWIAALPDSTQNRAIIFFWFVFSTKIFTNATFDLVFPYTAEYYPTRLRGTGVGYGSSAARVGGMVTPYVALHLHQHFGKHFPYMNFTIAACVGVAFVYFLPEVNDMFEEIQDNNTKKHLGDNDEADLEGEGVALLSAE